MKVGYKNQQQGNSVNNVEKTEADSQRVQRGKVASSTVNQSRARRQAESTHVDFPRGMAQFINKGNGKMVCKLIYLK